MYIHIYMYISIYVYTYIYNYLLVYTCSSFMGSIFTATDDPVFAALTSLWLFWIDKSSVSEKVLCKGGLFGKVCVCVYVLRLLLWHGCAYSQRWTLCDYSQSTKVGCQRKSCRRGLVCEGVCVYMHIYYIFSYAWVCVFTASNSLWSFWIDKNGVSEIILWKASTSPPA